MPDPAPTLNPDAVEAALLAYEDASGLLGLSKAQVGGECWEAMLRRMSRAIAPYEAAQWQRGDQRQPPDGTEVLIWDQGHIDHGIWSEGLWLIRETNVILPAEKVWWRPMLPPPGREDEGG